MLNKQQLGSKIKELREEKGLSQQDLAKSLNISRPALSEIERGNRSLDTEELSRIASFFNLKIDDLVNPWLEIKSRSSQKNVNEKIQFNPAKLKQLILYILEKCGGKANFGETVLYKLLYFVDFDSYENLGKPIAGMNYVKLQFGPVPQAVQFQTVIEDMKVNKEIKVFIQDYHGMKQTRYVSLIDNNLADFTIPEKNIIDEVIGRLANMSATQIEAYSHGDVPWQVVSPKEIIPYDLVLDRESPYTKRNYWQDWQNAAGSDALKRLGPMSKEESDYYANL